MSVASERFSSSLRESPNSASILSRMEPEPLRRICENASYSPWMSEAKNSVPFGRFKMALRLMISAEALAAVGNDRERSSKYRFSLTSM